MRFFSNFFLYKFLLIAQEALRYIFVLHVWKTTLSKFEVIVFPFSGQLSAEFGNLVWTTKKIQKISLAVQENWDNLSTKSFIYDEPNIFAVWGQQSGGHVRSVHQLFKSQIKYVGCARFLPYFESDGAKPHVSRGNLTTSKILNDFILIGGTGDGIDDELLIDSCHSILIEENLRNKVDLVYRPHPMTRFQRDYLELENKYPGLMVDCGPASRNFGHHTSLVKNCRLLINHFSTLSIEGLVSETPVCVPLFLGRKTANYRYFHILNEWHHMMGLALIPNLNLPETTEQMKAIIKLSLKDNMKKNFIDLGWICRSGNWVNHMREALESITLR